LALLFVPGAGLAAGRPHARPNIVVILVDDKPALDERLQRLTPTVNSLFVVHGVQFTDFHSETPLCCPVRAGYLTGLHTYNHRVTQNDAALSTRACRSPSRCTGSVTTPSWSAST